MNSDTVKLLILSIFSLTKMFLIATFYGNLIYFTLTYSLYRLSFGILSRSLVYELKAYLIRKLSYFSSTGIRFESSKTFL
jgi:hypothetical protein